MAGSRRSLKATSEESGIEVRENLKLCVNTPRGTLGHPIKQKSIPMTVDTSAKVWKTSCVEIATVPSMDSSAPTE